MPSHDLLKSLTSKLRLIDIAASHNISLPPSIKLKDESDLKKIPSSFFPAVLKPESQAIWWTQKAREIGIVGLKALPVANIHELRSIYSRIREVDSKLILQKMIVGPDENHIDYHSLIDSNGEIVAEFVGKKLRLTPAHFGMGCYVESAKSAEVINEGRSILRSLNYSGMANMNFKRDERDGRLYFMELNPRFSFWIGLDCACGVDFPYYYYKLCLKEQIIANKEYPIGKKWISLYHDIREIKTISKDGSLTWKQWIRSILKADIGAVYAPDDSMTALMLPFEICKRMAKRFITMIKKKAAVFWQI